MTAGLSFAVVGGFSVLLSVSFLFSVFYMRFPGKSLLSTAIFFLTDEVLFKYKMISVNYPHGFDLGRGAASAAPAFFR